MMVYADSILKPFQNFFQRAGSIYPMTIHQDQQVRLIFLVNFQGIIFGHYVFIARQIRQSDITGQFDRPA